MATVEQRPTWPKQIMSPEDLVEGESYEEVHSHLRETGRKFRLCVKGETKAAISYKDMPYPDDYFFYSDMGLTPYPSGRWNESNYIRHPIPEWADDWM